MKDVSTVKVLLENCIKLIDNDQNSQVRLSHHLSIGLLPFSVDGHFSLLSTSRSCFEPHPF